MATLDTSNLGADDAPKAPLSFLFYLMGPESCQAVTEYALAARHRVSAELRDGLDRAVNIAARVSGFRSASLAPPAYILPQLCEAIPHSADLAAAVTRVWYERQEELRDIVAAELERSKIALTLPSFPAGEVRVGAATRSVYEALQRCREANPDTDRNQVVFMFQLLTGISDVDLNPEEEGPVIADLLDSTLLALAALPATGSEWDEAIPEFSRSLADLVEQKQEQRKLVGPLRELLDSISGEHADLLAFFQCDTSAWLLADVDPAFSFQRAQEHGESLRGLLAQYAPIHERAPVVVEEMERARQRLQLVPRIIESTGALNGLFSGEERSEAEQGMGTGEYEPDPVCRKEVEAAFDPSGKTDAGGQNELSGPPTLVPACDIEGHLLLRLTCEDLEQENEDLEHENDGLKAQVKELEQKLHESRSQEESLRWAVAYRDNPGETEEVPQVETVGEAVQLAKERYPGQLLFELNADSDADGSLFKWPDQVWNALCWLATEYFTSHLGDHPIPNLDEACRQACGMWYKTSQHETTMTQFRESYTTRVNGRVIWLGEHIGKGNSFDPRRTIRIAFDWDRQLQKVIIGYIGQHQRTAAT